MVHSVGLRKGAMGFGVGHRFVDTIRGNPREVSSSFCRILLIRQGTCPGLGDLLLRRNYGFTLRHKLRRNLQLTSRYGVITVI